VRFAVAALLLFLPISSLAQDRAAVEAEIDRLRRELRIPALSAAVVEGGTTVWVRHLGFKAAPSEPVQYPIASLTKPFAAVIAMQLAEKGALKLDGPAPSLRASADAHVHRFARRAIRLQQ